MRKNRILVSLVDQLHDDFRHAYVFQGVGKDGLETYIVVPRGDFAKGPSDKDLQRRIVGRFKIEHLSFINETGGWHNNVGYAVIDTTKQCPSLSHVEVLREKEYPDDAQGETLIFDVPQEYEPTMNEYLDYRPISITWGMTDAFTVEFFVRACSGEQSSRIETWSYYDGKINTILKTVPIDDLESVTDK